MKAYIFPGQGAQFTGMGKDIYESNAQTKALFDQANDILGFKITEVMFNGSANDLKQTNVAQPAIFLHSVALIIGNDSFTPDMVAGHSLGEFSALVANKSLSFKDGLELVAKRAKAMQHACEINPSTMAAIIGLADNVVEEICASIDDIVVAANYNCPGQLVISGTMKGIDIAVDKMRAAGARHAIHLHVGGAFHSPLMQPAREELAAAIETTMFSKPICPVYQNVNALPATDSNTIKQNLIAQLTAPVRWTQSVQNMVNDGGKTFIECGPGKVLQGLVKKISTGVEAMSL